MHPHVQKNLYKFKATFQKPSQIYKFLQGRWRNHPLFLNRTLSYVSKHRDRKIRQRDTSIDKISKKLGRGSIKRENDKVVFKRQHKSNSLLDGYSTGTELNNATIKKENSLADKGPVCCYFNWICDDAAKTSQKTRSFGYVCPWCENDSRHLDTFMMHLKCCHPRFNYNLVEENDYPVIEMTLNLSYDGSYCGFKFPGHDLRRDFRFTPKSPHRRQPQTLFTYFKSKRQNNNLTNVDTYPDHHLDPEMFYDDGEADIDVCSGRLYYHTSTCLPIKPNEGDIDSEADMDPEWLKERTQLMIDEFTDVNEGEKEILKLWNLHMMRNYKYRADNMIRQACLDFVQIEGAKILSGNLTKNFTLHLANLYDFGLISSRDILECIRMLRGMRQPPQLITASPTRAANKIRQEQRNEHCQHSPPAKRALLNSQYNQMASDQPDDSSVQTAESLWINREFFILINALHCSLTIYYSLYELLVEILAALGYHKLPKDQILGHRQHSVWLTSGLKLLILLGSILTLIGSANLKLRYLLSGWVLLVPFPIIDLYFSITNQHATINLDDFLLFQVLFTTLLKPLRIVVIISNLLIILQPISF